MKKVQFISIAIISLMFLGACTCKYKSDKKNGETLRNALDGKFYMGVAVNKWQTNDEDSLVSATIINNFNSIVAENCMKSERLQPKEGEFFFDDADAFVNFGEEHGMHIVGHCLIWHSQAPRWFFSDENGEDVSREVMIDRVKTHITEVVSHYKGRISGWDVVNEAFNDDGTMRNSKYLQIIGEDYIKLAFQFAHEADPDAELYYNDYNTAKSAKCDSIYKLIKELQSQGIQVDGIGMQAHLTMSFPTAEEMENSIVKFSELGKVMITEMDMTVLPWPADDVSADVSLNFAADPKWNPYPETLSDSTSIAWTNRYMEFFNVFLKYSDKIDRVTMWGLNDGQTWRNNWPIRGRSDYPVLFNRENKPKPVVAEIIEAAAARN